MVSIIMNLQEKSKEISQSLSILGKELEEQKRITIKTIDEMTEELKDAAGQGDRSENAAFTEALSKLSMLNFTLSTIDTRLKTIHSKVHESNYNSIGLITYYTTVWLVANTGMEFVFKLYPEGVSDVAKGIISADSPIGKAIWLKEVGNIIILEHLVTGEAIEYKIVSIY